MEKKDYIVLSSLTINDKTTEVRLGKCYSCGRRNRLTEYDDGSEKVWLCKECLQHRGLEVIVETSKSKKEFKISKISFNGLELTEFNGDSQ